MNKKSRQNQRLDALEERFAAFEGALGTITHVVENMSIYLAEKVAKEKGFSGLAEFIEAQQTPEEVLDEQQKEAEPSPVQSNVEEQNESRETVLPESTSSEQS